MSEQQDLPFDIGAAREAWWRRVENMETGRVDPAQLRGLLNNPDFMAAIKQVVAVTADQRSSLAFLQMDLTTEEGIKKAIQKQATAKACFVFLDDLFSLAHPEPNPKKE